MHLNCTSPEMEAINCNFENWGAYILKQFQYMYEKGEKCDLEISCNKQIFLVHRLIMSSCSDYVRDLDDKQHIILPDEVSCRTLKTVINFIYTGKITFNKEEKEELLLAASLLNMRLLVELIKPEESGGYTVQLDDEDIDESFCDSKINLPNTETNGVPETTPEQPLSNTLRQGTKRKAEVKHNKHKSSKNNSVLPPLHKFPYLQQKFSASRTYGLITNLTSPKPSRFHISDDELQNSSYRSNFENVSYDTKKLFRDCDNLTPLEPEHLQFLKKLREGPGHKRYYSYGLYSPFDKFQPQYNPRTTELNISRRSDTVVSYPSKAENARNKIHASNSTTSTSTRGSTKATQAQTVVPSPTASVKPCITVTPSTKSYKKTTLGDPVSKTVETITTPVATPTNRKQVRFSENIDVREIDSTDFTAQAMKELEVLPEPIKPSQIVEGPCSIDIDDTTELTNLDNVVVPENYEQTQPEVDAEVEVGGEPQTLTCLTNVSPDFKEVMEVDESLPEDPLAETTRVESTELAEASEETEITIADDSTTDDSPISDSMHPNVKTSEPATKRFVLKVKGNETQDQLSKLVGLCKQNSLFKDKNVRFKLVPVKSLKDQAFFGSGINKAIIVKRTESSTNSNTTSSVSAPASTSTTATVTISNKSKSTETSSKVVDMNCKKVSSIENVTSPWICFKCNGGEGEDFSSYFDFRTHLHAVHNEPNNPVYCIHCGYKSLKRNMQLYHLFVKHNISPPSHITFPKCEKCEFHALNDYALQKHLSSHPSAGMEYVCSCKVAFRTSEILQKHISSGDCKNSKSFTCGYCRSVFDRFVNLKAHMRVCMKERSKPMLENSVERVPKTVSDGGKEYVAL